MMKYSIGRFSAMVGMSPKTLRYYDEIGLLPPAEVDYSNRYRYYDRSSLLRSEQIRIYRNCGLSLEAIRDLIERAEEGNSLIGILRQQIEVLKEKKQEINRSLVQVEALLETLEKTVLSEGKEVFLDAEHVLFLCEEGSHPELPGILSRLYEASVREHHEVCGFHRRLLFEEEERTAMIEVQLPVKPGEESNFLKRIPSRRMCQIIHHGPLTTLPESYERLLQFVLDRKLEVSGPFEEVYSSSGGVIRPDRMEVVLRCEVTGG